MKKRRTHIEKEQRKVVARAPEKPVYEESQPVVTAQVVAAPEPVAPKPRVRRDKPAKRVVVADPPPLAPEPVDAVSTTPLPPEPTPDGTTTTPPVPCQVVGAAGCPPPRPPVLTCRTCGIVAPVPPPRRPLRLVDPNSVNNTP